jgi:hypothetical protein
MTTYRECLDRKFQKFNIGDRITYDHYSYPGQHPTGIVTEFLEGEDQNRVRIHWDNIEELNSIIISQFDQDTVFGVAVIAPGTIQYSPEQNGDVEEDI